MTEWNKLVLGKMIGLICSLYLEHVEENKSFLNLQFNGIFLCILIQLTRKDQI